MKVSPACDHCYAEGFAKRVGQPVWGVDAPRRFFGDKHWNEPLKWNKIGGRVFCASMADVFEDRAELIPHRERLWSLIQQTPNLRWNLLTKRERMIKQFLPKLGELPNVRFGVTVENQTYDHRIVEGVSWLSVEPMLGPLDLLHANIGCPDCHGECEITDPNHDLHPSRTGDAEDETWCPTCTDAGERIKIPGIDWVIVGGESGPGAREMKLEWAIDLIRQCKDADVAVHFKQTGDVLARKLGLKDKSGKDPSEWPAELRIQEFPV